MICTGKGSGSGRLRDGWASGVGPSGGLCRRRGFPNRRRARAGTRCWRPSTPTSAAAGRRAVTTRVSWMRRSSRKGIQALRGASASFSRTGAGNVGDRTHPLPPAAAAAHADPAAGPVDPTSNVDPAAHGSVLGRARTCVPAGTGPGLPGGPPGAGTRAPLPRSLGGWRPGGLDPWLHEVDASGIAELIGFATGLRRDRAAVEAAFTTPWSQGQTEGQVNRIKTLKRSMYRRAKFDLLRQRVLHPA